MANTAMDSEPIHHSTCVMLMKKFHESERFMLEHVSGGSKRTGMSNSWMLRVSLRELQFTLNKILDGDKVTNNERL